MNFRALKVDFALYSLDDKKLMQILSKSSYESLTLRGPLKEVEKQIYLDS